MCDPGPPGVFGLVVLPWAHTAINCMVTDARPLHMQLC